ncbi:hypothetical protein B0T25DRAFT_556216 [Lasiosphaeria hispida]|uniref:Secreted protein n=1 Tax=Lasiosphaeria hispida TaxID=260671 RepID=A0AAJ0M9L5_9PEZI|nr:hypothetical protein B0T25DRAFT_556216 [Lasiosphaeria hispida]
MFTPWFCCFWGLVWVGMCCHGQYHTFLLDGLGVVLGPWGVPLRECGRAGDPHRAVLLGTRSRNSQGESMRL